MRCIPRMKMASLDSLVFSNALKVVRWPPVDKSMDPFVRYVSAFIHEPFSSMKRVPIFLNNASQTRLLQPVKHNDPPVGVDLKGYCSTVTLRGNVLMSASISTIVTSASVSMHPDPSTPPPGTKCHAPSLALKSL